MFSLSKFVPSKRASEIEFLLCCVRGTPDPETKLLIQQLVKKKLDWDYLLQTALQNRVMPIFYKNLIEICPQAVPQNIMCQLQKLFLGNAARSYLFTNRLIKILTVFEDNDITAIPFKGPILAENIYGDISLRQFDDLDILVYPQDVSKAHKLLTNFGYRPQFNLNSGQVEAYIKKEYSFTYFMDKSRIVIELHWKLLGRHSSFSLDLNTIHTNFSSTLNKKPVRSFSLEDLLLYQCLHSSKDTWNILENICCIAEIINLYKEINWKVVETRARKMRCERMLLLGLFLAFDLFEPALPAHLIHQVENDSVLQKIVRMIYGNIFDKNSELKKPIGSDFSLLHMKMRDRFLEQVHYGLAIIFNPSREEWRICPLPASLSFLYYIFRPIRLVTGFGRSLLKPKLSVSNFKRG